MFAGKLIEHFQNDLEVLSTEFINKITRSEHCSELLLRVSPDEQRQSTREIYQHLTTWLRDGPARREDYYINLGTRRARQGVPFHELLSVICAAREYFCDYIERETLLDAPTDFWGSVKLLRALDSCFDNALYFTSKGYQRAIAQESVAVTD